MILPDSNKHSTPKAIETTYMLMLAAAPSSATPSTRPTTEKTTATRLMARKGPILRGVLAPRMPAPA